MSDTIPQDTPLKQCSICGNSYPATRHYFCVRKNTEDGLLSRCKNCRVPHIQVPEGCKRCSKCKGVFAATAEFFHRDKVQADGWNSQCKQCVKVKTKRDYQAAKEKPIENRPDELVCKKCNTPKPTTEEFFFRNPQGPYGLQHICKECNDKRRRQYEQEHPERVVEIRRGIYLRAKAKGTLYWMTHPERTALIHRKYYQAHKMQHNERNRRYAKTERGRLIATTRKHNRRARERMAKGRFTANDIRRQFKAQKGKCYWCGTKLGSSRRDYHVDHVIPLSRGGSNDPSNIVIACLSCNTSKADQLPHEWRGNNGKLW